MEIDRLIQILSDGGAEFIVIGGWSAILHGSVHVTNDLDVFFSRGSGNVKRLAQALAPYHPRPIDLPEGLPFIWDEATLRNGTNFTLMTDLGRVDLLGEVSGLGSFPEVYAASIPMEKAGREVRVLDLLSLIESKKAAGRVKALLVIPELEALLEAQENEPGEPTDR
jgi:hypothetical protein